MTCGDSALQPDFDPLMGTDKTGLASAIRPGEVPGSRLPFAWTPPSWLRRCRGVRLRSRERRSVTKNAVRRGARSSPRQSPNLLDQLPALAQQLAYASSLAPRCLRIAAVLPSGCPAALESFWRPRASALAAVEVTGITGCCCRCSSQWPHPAASAAEQARLELRPRVSPCIASVWEGKTLVI
jgi:hypothetical protein